MLKLIATQQQNIMICYMLICDSTFTHMHKMDDGLTIQEQFYRTDKSHTKNNHNDSIFACVHK